MEKKIKDNFDYEIKTTSNDILNKYNKTINSRKDNNHSLKYKLISSITASLAAVTAFVFVFLYITGNKSTNSTSTKQSLVDKSIYSKLSLEVYYSSLIMSDEHISLCSLEQNEFDRIINDIEAIYPIFDRLDSKKDGLSVKSYSTDYTYNNVDYKFVLEIENEMIYLLEDITNLKEEYEGKCLLSYSDGSQYEGIIDLDLEDDEMECEIIYYVEGYTYKLSREMDTDEYEINLEIEKDGEDICEYSIELEYKNKKLEFEYKFEDKINDDKDIVLSLVYKNNTYFVTFKDESKDIDVSDVALRVDSEYRTYSYENKIKKIKK